MMKNYLKRSALILGAAAIVSMANAKYVDVTRQYIKDPTFVPGWQGTIGATSDGVAETWSSAFQTYQNLGDMPAGKYVLTVNAFYRCGHNDYARDNQIGNPELNTCYIFINDAKQTVAPLHDGRENRPNSMWEANQAFEAGDYLNTVEYDHKGGELIIGIRNTGCYFDEWCCFDNFKLTCDGVDVPIENGDFSEGINAKRSWNNVNSGNSEKVPDAQKDGATGGTYRKCGGSPYNTAQQVTLPAGTYRFGMQCFHRYGSHMDAEGNYYNHKTGEKCDAYGSKKRTPKDWFEANDYDQVPDDEYAHAYIFMSKNEDKPKSVAWDDSEAEGDLVNGVDVRTRVRDCWEICNGDLSIMPQNNPMGPRELEGDAYVPYETKNNCYWFHDSGHEREAGAAFVNDPDKWYQYVEFTLTEETTVWLGLGKDENSGDGYWHAYANISLMVSDGNDEEASDIDPDTNRVPELIDWNEDGQFIYYPEDFYCEGGVVYDEDEAAFVFDRETLGHICLDLKGKMLDMSEVANIEVKGSFYNTSDESEGEFGPGAWGGNDPISTLYIGRTLDGKFNAINEWWGSRYSINFKDFAPLADKVTKFQFNGRVKTITEGEGDDAVTIEDGFVPGFVYLNEVVLTKSVEADPMGITGDWWHEWDNWDETANIVASNLGYCGVQLNTTLGAGSPFAGVLNGTVPGNVYADMTQYAGIYVKGTPGTPWRGLFNRQSLEDAGDYINVVVNLHDEGEAYIIFSQLPELQGETYIHLNTVKINWGAPDGCKITKFNYIDGAGIENVIVTTPYNGKMYNLQGIEVNDSYKGLVIKNGVKFFNK